MQRRIDRLNAPLDEIPLRQRAGRSKPIASYERTAGARDEAIAKAYASGGYTLREIGEHFGLHYSLISRVIQSHEARGKL